jgi:RecB family exonuclease
VTLETLPEAERILLTGLEARRGEFRLSSQQTRVRAAIRRLEFDLLRYLRHDAESDSRFEPEHLEYEFGPVELAWGVRLRGKVDRVDVWDGYALIRDYKSGKSADRYKVASWEKENRFQAALYMLVVEEVLELAPAGGVYVPLGGTERRPRGMVAKHLNEVGSDFYPNDRLDPEGFAARLDWARERIVETAGRMERGELECTPDTCAWDGGCAYPSICRCEG